MSAVELKGIRFRYQGAVDEALKGIDLSVDPGEKTAIIGLTGAGKSTLMKCMNRLVPASYRGEFEGLVSVLGEDVSKKSTALLSGKVGMVFQDFESQLFSTTAELDVAFGPENLGLSGDEIRTLVTGALRSVDMEDLRRRESSTLSGGQKQRLAIASVLSLGPKILCLDEPTTDLDPDGRQEVALILERLSSQGGAIILAEHEIDLLDKVDRIIGLEQGRKVFDQPAETILQDDQTLSRFGVRPPDLVQVVKKLNLPDKPHDLNETYQALIGKGIRFKNEAQEQLDVADRSALEREGKELIRLDNIYYQYPNGVEALKDVSVSIKAGEFVALLGNNGSGKTTLVKHLNGLLRPGDGAVFIDGEDVSGKKVAELGRRVGLVFQDPDHQIFAARVFDEVAFAPRNYRFSESDVKDRVQRSLKLVGLDGFEDRDPFLLTKGERQRVAIASILSADPEVIILDEPTTGLDYQAQRAVMDLLAGLNQEGRTVIVITHSLWVAAQYTRRCLIMNNGRVAGEGPTRSILTDTELMRSAGLRTPQILALGKKMGATTLTVDEFLSSLEGGK